MLALGVRDETLGVAEAELANETHEDRLDGDRGGGRGRDRRRRRRLLAALGTSVANYTVTMHDREVGVGLRRGAALLLLLLLVGLVRVQPGDVVGARDLRKHQRVGNRDAPAVDDASVGQRVVLAQLALALDDVGRAVRVVDDLAVELLNIAAGRARTRAGTALLLIADLRRHCEWRRGGCGGGGGVSNRCWSRDCVASARFRTGGWACGTRVMGLMKRSPGCRGRPAPSATLFLRTHLLLLLRVRGILKGCAVLLLMMMGRHQLLIELMLPDCA